MTLLLVLIIPFLVILAVLTIVDVLKHPYGGWAKAAWVLVIIFLPVIASGAYWIMRRPAENDAELAYRAEADERLQRQRLPIDRSGF